MNKQYSIFEIDWDKSILTTLEGKTFNINPYDMSVLAGWTPTTPIREITINGNRFIENQSDGTKAKLL